MTEIMNSGTACHNCFEACFQTPERIRMTDLFVFSHAGVGARSGFITHFANPEWG